MMIMNRQENCINSQLLNGFIVQHIYSNLTVNKTLLI